VKVASQEGKKKVTLEKANVTMYFGVILGISYMERFVVRKTVIFVLCLVSVHSTVGSNKFLVSFLAWHKSMFSDHFWP